MRPASRNLSPWPSSGGPGLELVGAAALALVLLGALATQIRHREGLSHVAFAALTLLLVIVQSYLSIAA